jgi:hypothetical protein
MLDRVGEQLTSPFEIVAGVKEPIDLRAVLGPLLDLVVITFVREQRFVQTIADGLNARPFRRRRAVNGRGRRSRAY